MFEWLGVTPLALVAICAGVLVAGFIRGLTGFGLALILVPLISQVIAPERAVLFGVLMALLTAPLGYPAARKEVDPKLTRTIIITGALTAPLGQIALSFTPPDLARLLVALVAVAGAVALAVPRPPALPPGEVAAARTGLLAGFLGGFAAMPGPPIIHHFVRRDVKPAISRNAMIVVFGWNAVIVALVALLRGRLDLPTAALALLAFPALMVSNKLGARYFGLIAEAVWRRIVFTVIAVAAVGALVRLLA
ncbi:MAG: sulfite exporter TauE/SafE family protein [Alphaproteobacteria bacterium]|nr:sulfite exporter TauE/SafE family protein [Alphaproteobacteria bacterium]